MSFIQEAAFFLANTLGSLKVKSKLLPPKSFIVGDTKASKMNESLLYVNIANCFSHFYFMSSDLMKNKFEFGSIIYFL